MTLAIVPESDPWLQMPDEHPRAYFAFNVYLQLGTNRSIDKAYVEATGKQGFPASGKWKQWSGKWKWFQRAGAWDRHLAETARRAIIDTAEASAKSRIASLRGMMGIGMQVLSKADVSSLTPEEARILLPAAARIVELATSGLREEYGVQQRPELHGHIVATSGIRQLGEFYDFDLLKKIAAKEQGLGDIDPEEYDVTGAGIVVPRSPDS